MKAASPSHASARSEWQQVGSGLDFLWIELTNRCNLKCVHCYTESGPQTGDRDLLTADDYLSVMTQAYALGCRKMQFIGGEPLLNPDFQRLLEASKAIGFEFVEVFTNLTRLDEETLRFAQSANIHFATSVYSDKPDVHNAVTKNKTSHARTIGNLKRLVENGITTRAAVIQIDQTPLEIETTKRFLTDLGVQYVRSSRVRAFGRGEELLSQPTQMSELCGACWKARLCVAPDGAVYPCVMARQWLVGNVRDTTLASIVRSVGLREIRATIHETVWLPRLAAGQAADGHAVEGEPDHGDKHQHPGKSEPIRCTPSGCGPDVCDPERCDPEACDPGCPQSCEPNSCDPDCPQSCQPNSCDPDCPQSCGPIPPN